LSYYSCSHIYIIVRIEAKIHCFKKTIYAKGPPAIIIYMLTKNKIIHLSDLHIGYQECGVRAAKIIENIIKFENPNDSIIIITGDLVERARQAKDFTVALELLAKLRAANFKVLLCPGNHDYGTGVINSRQNAQEFRRLFMPEVASFPQLDIIGERAFIGLDSNEDELHWYDRFFADGELGVGQLAKLDKMLNDPKLKDKTKVVYLHHHPFNVIPFHKLKDSQKLKKVIENRIDVLLYGHLHVGQSHNNTWGIKVVLDGGSSTGKRMPQILGFKIKHRVINLADFSIVEKDYLEG